MLLAASWVLLGQSGTEWVAFALLVLVPIVVPVGFIFVVGQAGMLLDVRTLKALYARVVAGFALGVVVGGLAGPILLDALGETADLLAAAAAAAGLLLALGGPRPSGDTRRSSPRSSTRTSAHERPTLGALSRNRFVVLIVAFQMLSAVESQWLDFLVYDRAAQRYEDSTEMARFVSQFAAIAYGTDILFLLLLAGFLLRRHGLRYGLTANSLGVLTVVAAIIVATTIQGAGATLVFVLVVAARVVDLTFSDGTSRTSLSAAYQAVPNSVRAVVQATVEGLAVPLAIGISGVVLLLVDAAGYTDSLLLPVMTALVVIAWVRGRHGPVPRVRRQPARQPARAHARHHDVDRRGREQPDRDRPPRRESRRARRAARARPPHRRSAPGAPREARAARGRRPRQRPHRRPRAPARPGSAPRGRGLPGRVSMTPPRRCGRRACECWVRPAIRQMSRRSWRGRGIRPRRCGSRWPSPCTRLGEPDERGDGGGATSPAWR